MLAKADESVLPCSPEHYLSLDKLMACVSKTNLVSEKKFSPEDLSAITKSTQFSRAVREEKQYRTKTRQSNLKRENNLP